MVGACLQFRGTSKAQVLLVLSSITFLPGIGASRPRHLPGIWSPAKPKVGILPRKKNVKVVVSVGEQLSKVSANLPGRAADMEARS